MLKVGIVGLPNVGKSTLFNGLTRSHKAAAENYPFCTIEPNLGVVTVPEPRLEEIARVVRVARSIPAAIEFVDIAGLVRGASQGEGLGNRFLSHIREVDAVVHVVRCFEDPDIHHVTGSPEPLRDIEIVTTELVLADLEAVQRRQEKIHREVKSGNAHALAESAVLDKCEAHLNQGRPAMTLSLSREEWELSRHAPLLTAKPVLFAANVREGQIGSGSKDPYVAKVDEYTRTHHACDTIAVCAQLESDLSDLTAEEAGEYLRELGVEESGTRRLIRAVYALLGLRTFFTFNANEVRAWTIHAGDTAPRAAGAIHSDFESGFIKAETVGWADLVKYGSVSQARQAGAYRVEGREYEVRDGDVLLFKFHN